MKKIILFFLATSLIFHICSAQNLCNSSGNLMIFTNYEGGDLFIDINVNIADLKIGVISYHSVNIYIAGAYASNITAVSYIGNNAPGTYCGFIDSTSFNGAGTASTSIAVLPPPTLANSFGNIFMVCGYSCDIGTWQGGCNTVDQIEHYFVTQFAGSSVYAHKVQYDCWLGVHQLSAGGTCCGLVTEVANPEPTTALSVYPNPASDKLNIETTEKVIAARLINNLGQDNDIIVENNSVGIESLSPGVYSLMLNMENGIQVIKRFVKE